MTETLDQPTFVDGACVSATPPNPHGFVTFEIQVDGFQYPVKLSTKSAPVLEQARLAAGNPARWHYIPSQGGPNPHSPGTFYTNRRLSRVEPLLTADGPPTSSAPADRPETPVSPPSPVSPATQGVPAATAPASTGDRDALIVRQVAVKALGPAFCQAATMGNPADRAALEGFLCGLAARLEQFMLHGPVDPDDVPFG